MKGFIENMLIINAQAVIMIASVMILRKVLNKTNKIFTYIMWLVVLVRLCIPVSFESSYGVLDLQIDKKENTGYGVQTEKGSLGGLDKYNSLDNEGNDEWYKQENDTNLSMDSDKYLNSDLNNNSNNNLDKEDIAENQNTSNLVNKTESQSTVDKEAQILGSSNSVLSQTYESKEESDYKSEHLLAAREIFMMVWLVGMIVVAVIALGKFISLKKNVRFAIHSKDNIWETDSIETAFVYGLFRAKIYVPSGICVPEEREYIILHEKMHIRHGDHIVRIIMLLVNIVYWCNPIVWVATYYMKKDMEMLCDESVIKFLKSEEHSNYLRTLLKCSAKNSGILPVMSFGESNAETRIKHIVCLRKPKFYIVFVLMLFLFVSTVGCALVTTKGDNDKNEVERQGTTYDNTDEGLNNDGRDNNKEQPTEENTVGTVDDNNDKDDKNEEPQYTTDSKKDDKAEITYGRYIPVSEGRTDYIDIKEYRLKIIDTSKFDSGKGKELVEYRTSNGYRYCTEYSYNIIRDYINTDEKYDVFEIRIIDKVAIKYKGELYIHEDYSNKQINTELGTTGYPQYDNLIKKMSEIYHRDEESLWDILENNNICYIWEIPSVFENGGFYLVDLDGDGIEELLLGENGSGEWAGTIYEIYTIQDEKLVKLCEGGERDRYYLANDNVILNEGSSGAGSSYFGYSTVKNGKLILGMGIAHESYSYMKEPYIAEVDENNIIKRYITDEEYDEAVNRYTALPIEFTLFEVVNYK